MTTHVGNRVTYRAKKFTATLVVDCPDAEDLKKCPRSSEVTKFTFHAEDDLEQEWQLGIGADGNNFFIYKLERLS